VYRIEKLGRNGRAQQRALEPLIIINNFTTFPVASIGRMNGKFEGIWEETVAA
jgi:hypothetical protein